MNQNGPSESTGFESSWKVDRSSGEGSTQTDDVSSNEQSSQAGASQDVQVQTESSNNKPVQLSADAEKRLADFLKKIEPSVVKELDRVVKSHDLLRAIETNSEEEREPPKCLYNISIKPVVPQQVECMSWSATGAVLAVGLGYSNHEAWCSHDSTIQLYNINMQDFDGSTPSETLDSPSCVTSLCHHPVVPSLLAAGTFSGELLVWGGEHRIVVRTVAGEGHAEAVTSIVWLAPSQHGPHTLLTAGLDGRLLAWRLETETGPLKLQHSFAILCKHLPTSQSPDDLLPVTSLAVIGRGRPMCVVGTQAGLILLCDLVDLKDDPVVGNFKGHQGSVTTLHTHPSAPHIFVSCGQDREVHVYHVKQETAMKVIHCSRSCIGAAWGAGGALAWWGGGSEVEVLALQGKEMTQKQVATLEPEQEAHATSLAFNTKIPRLVAVGDSTATVRIWKTPLPPMHR